MRRIHLLGRIDLRDEDGRELRPILSQPKRLALIAYLAAAAERGGCRRDELLGVFWPELSQERARKALNKAVHFLRRELGNEAIASRSAEQLAVDLAFIWYDAAQFDQAVASGAYSDALALYQGELLPAFYVRDAPAFEEWLERERARLRRLAAEAARGAAESSEQHGRATTAVGYARRAVELSDHDERVVRELLSMLDRLGDRAGALFAYERFTQSLSSELGAEPSAETQMLVERIRARGQPTIAVPSTSASAAARPETNEMTAALRAAGYVLGDEIARGGMATVYRATDIKHDRTVAVKLLAPELHGAALAERFLAEVRTTANLGHPHILPLFDSGNAGGRPFYVMPFVSGQSLRARLDLGRLPVAETLELIRAVSSALDHAHRRSILHRDIKPENILLQDGQPLLADFGIALALRSAAAERITATGLSLGTPQYMSPEQAVGERALGPESDVYSLGAITYEMLTGRPPFEAPTAREVLARVLTEAPVPPIDLRADLPPHINSAVLRALAKAPEDRFASAGMFVEALTATTASVLAARRAVSWSLLRQRTVAVIAATIVVLLVIGSVLMRGGRPPALMPDLLVVAPFEVLAPDLALWREGLPDVLARSLDGAGRLRTVSPSVALKSFSGRADASTSAALARRTGARLAMFGVLQRSGRDSVRASATVIDALSRRTLGEVDRRDAADRIDRLVDSVSMSVLRLLSPGSSHALRDIGTHSLPALKQYLQGSYWLRRYGNEAARDSASNHLERAVELDSGFALAWSALAALQTWPPPNLGLARKFGFRAAALNHGLGPRDSMVLLGDSLTYATGGFDPFAGLQDAALWSHLTRLYALTDRLARENPRDAYSLMWYADLRFHMPLVSAGVTDADVLTAFDRAIAADSTDLAAWRHAVPLSYFVAGREAGRRHLTALATVIPDTEEVKGVQLNLRLESAGALTDRALRGIWDAAGPDAQRASGKEWLGSAAFARDSGSVEIRLREPITRASWVSSDASNPFWAGRLTYRGRLRDAAAIPQLRNTPAFAVLVKAGLVSNDSVSAALREWNTLSMMPQPCVWLMDWWAARADTTAITTCVMHLRRPLSDTSVKWREPMIRALNAYGAFYKHLARRDSAGAVRALEIGIDTLCPVLCAGWQLDRAAALAAVGRREEARRIVRARLGQSEQRSVYPMTQLQRARLAMRLGDTVTALNAYSLVADAWTGADPELQPFVAEAKRALTRVGSGAPRPSHLRP